MPDDPKSGTGEGEGGAASASGTPPASGGEAETPEQKIARLEAERDAAQKKYEDEQALRLAQLGKVEEANRMQREGSGAPPTRPADPLDQEILDLRAQIAAMAANGARDVASEAILRRLEAEKSAQDRDARFAHAKVMAEPYFAQIEDKAIGDRARELFASGKFLHPDIAISAAKGERYDASEKERTRLSALARTQEEDLKRRAASAPGVPPSAGGPGEQKRVVKLSEYTKLTHSDPNGAGKKLRQDRDAGRVVIDVTG